MLNSYWVITVGQTLTIFTKKNKNNQRPAPWKLHWNGKNKSNECEFVFRKPDFNHHLASRGSMNLGEFLDFSWLTHQTRITRYSFKTLATLNSVWDSPSGQKVSSKTEDQSWGGSDGKEFACNAGDLGLILGLGRSPGEDNGNPLQYSYLENRMDREPGRLQSTGSQRIRRRKWTSKGTKERVWT